jgi:hypothetical protein
MVFISPCKHLNAPQVKELNVNQGILPLWCLIDTKLGHLSVHLDETDCFAAWTYAGAIEGAFLYLCFTAP